MLFEEPDKKRNVFVTVLPQMTESHTPGGIKPDNTIYSGRSYTKKIEG